MTTQLPKNIKPNSWEHYLFLLAKHDFVWRSTEDSRFIEQYIEEENTIEKLRLKLDQRNEMYNLYSPYPK